MIYKTKENYSGVQIFQTSKGNKNWFEKSDSLSNQGLKLQCLAEQRETTFGFELSGG